MRSSLLSALAAGALLAVPATAGAAAGDLDSGFGSAGMFTETTPGSFDRYDNVTVAPDGTIVAAVDGHGARRHLADGSKDPLFVGRTMGQQETQTDVDNDVVVLPDGRVVVAGAYAGHATIARLTAGKGELDPAFGTYGRQRHVVGNSSELFALERDPATGDLIAIGRTYDALGHDHLLVIRWDEDGTLRPDFDGDAGNGDGIVQPPIGDDASGSDVAIDAQGRIVISAWGYDGDAYGHIVRLLPDGRLDTAFGGGDGYVKATAPLSTGFGAVAMAPEGRLVAIATHDDDSTSVTRFTDTGELDAGFGGGNVASPALPGGYLSDVVVAGDGSVLGVGTRDVDNPEGAHPLVVRLTAAGQPDPAFDGDGLVELQEDALFSGAALDIEGRLLAGGSGVVHVSENTTSADPLLARFVTATPATPGGGPAGGGASTGAASTSGASTPAAADTRRPVVGLAVAKLLRRASLRRTGRLRAAVSLDEAGSVRLVAKLKRRGARRAVAAGSVTVKLTAPGKATASITLSRAAKRALRSGRVTLTLVATGRDAAGNAAAKSLARRLR